MADDKYRLYIPCPSCGGSGTLSWGDSPTEGGNHECPTCKPNGEPFGPQVIEGLRHVYSGTLQKIDD